MSDFTEHSEHPVVDRVRDLLNQVDSLQQTGGEAFDLVGLARQGALLERAHEELTEALEGVERR
ncbi:hypothetical protein GII33_12615 [Gordonia pseudamarae]|jgi:hypothetical protein|uniref:Uncharacterized protein n=1 Tax=Gordonia pseudamarae TaxID=2831662 RepID=A0ABX6IJT0_9ACTN|nr:MULTISPECIES: hypothetical protein [Gordonia]MBD0024015.1 hypothetical protein [Gordonia sp. (in: high G+C Gram-positive bacteria)]QHN26677.1 hypothetical protein GII33_12615 [Gordonia pseudamarae]QHN35570.1 hypothetical protein GII31_12445 [Gordonia pseudamarae]